MSREAPWQYWGAGCDFGAAWGLRGPSAPTPRCLGIHSFPKWHLVGGGASQFSGRTQGQGLKSGNGGVFPQDDCRSLAGPIGEWKQSGLQANRAFWLISWRRLVMASEPFVNVGLTP